MSNDNTIIVTASLVCRRVEAQKPYVEDEDVKEVARLAFKEVCHDPMGWCRNDDLRFRAGIAALLLRYHNAETIKERIEYELRFLKAMSAATSGVPVDFSAVINESIEPIGLHGIYMDVKKEEGV